MDPEELKKLSRKELQKLAKEQGYNPNRRKDHLIGELSGKTKLTVVKRGPSCYFSLLPTEVVIEICLLLDYIEISRMMGVCRKFQEILNKFNFWKQKIQLEFRYLPYGLDKEEYKYKYLWLIHAKFEADYIECSSRYQPKILSLKATLDKIPKNDPRRKNLKNEIQQLENDPILPYLKAKMNKIYLYLFRKYPHETEYQYIPLVHSKMPVSDLLLYLKSSVFFIIFEKKLISLGKIQKFKEGMLIGIYDEQNLHLRPALVYVDRYGRGNLKFDEIISMGEKDFPSALKERITFLEGEDDLPEKIKRIYKLNFD